MATLIKKPLNIERYAVSVKELARIFNIGLNSAYDLVKTGRIKSVKIGKRIVIPIKEVEDFLAREVSQKVEE